MMNKWCTKKYTTDNIVMFTESIQLFSWRGLRHIIQAYYRQFLVTNRHVLNLPDRRNNTVNYWTDDPLSCCTIIMGKDTIKTESYFNVQKCRIKAPRTNNNWKYQRKWRLPMIPQCNSKWVQMSKSEAASSRPVTMVT